MERTKTLALPEIQSRGSADSAVGLLGSRQTPGVYLLSAMDVPNNYGNMRIPPPGSTAIPTPVLSCVSRPHPSGLNAFSWARNDGEGLQVFAQPYHNIQGVAGDAYGGLWWIETPQAGLDQWQLWHYDPAQNRDCAALTSKRRPVRKGRRQQHRAHACPVGRPARDPRRSVKRRRSSLTPWTVHRLQPYTGLYRLTVKTDETGAGQVTDGPLLLIEEGPYRGPLAVSPDLSRLAYFVYDAGHPSLTSGAVKPANTVNLLTLSGRGASIVRTAYTTETRFEFLSPDIAWQGNDRLLLARSRFADGARQHPRSVWHCPGAIAAVRRGAGRRHHTYFLFAAAPAVAAGFRGLFGRPIRIAAVRAIRKATKRWPAGRARISSIPYLVCRHSWIVRCFAGRPASRLPQCRRCLAFPGAELLCRLA